MKRDVLVAFMITVCILSLFGCLTATSQEDEIIQQTMTVTTQPTDAITPLVTAPQLQVTPSTLRGVQITFWYPWTGDTAATVKNMINEFNQTNEWGIFVIGENYPGEAAQFEAFNAVEQLSDLPDLLAAPLADVLFWQQDGVEFLDLSSFMQSSAWGFLPLEQGEEYADLWQQYVVDDFQWGVPAYQTMHLIFYNQSWAESLGFEDPPATSEEFRNQACTAAIANNRDQIYENDGMGGWIIDDQPETILAWMSSFGQAFGNDVAAQNTYSNSVTSDAFNYLHNLSADGCAWNALEPTPDDYLTDRNTMFYSGTLEDVIDQEYSIQWLASDDQWTVLPYIGSSRQTVLVSGDSYAILVNSVEKQMAAWLFTRWMNQPENHQRIVKVSGSLPLTRSEALILSGFGTDHPNWEVALSYLEKAEYPPRTSSWVIERMVLPDAFWQALRANTTEADIPAILERLDAMISELIDNEQ